ncbi:hypothetical protein ACFV3R_06415 [Streptomyces sp. NPDC059740]|uniref:hypothetical protein n=1 Tax=Streptomyces sp. NPDC059740 TaxID=3346926 RepID=UPI00365F4D39
MTRAGHPAPGAARRTVCAAAGTTLLAAALLTGCSQGGQPGAGAPASPAASSPSPGESSGSADLDRMRRAVDDAESAADAADRDAASDQ